MVVKNLFKVQKHIAKRKGKNATLHENSRDSRRLQRATARDEKLIKTVNARAMANQPHLQRISFLQAAAQNKSSPLTPVEINALMEEYISRDEEQLAALEAVRRPGRPPSHGEELLKRRRESERKEFAAGVWIPDMQDTNNLDALRDWNQEWVSLATMKFVRFARDGTVRPSSFPPKGMS